MTLAETRGALSRDPQTAGSSEPAVARDDTFRVAVIDGLDLFVASEQGSAGRQGVPSSSSQDLPGGRFHSIVLLEEGNTRTTVRVASGDAAGPHDPSVNDDIGMDAAFNDGGLGGSGVKGGRWSRFFSFLSMKSVRPAGCRELVESILVFGGWARDPAVRTFCRTLVEIAGRAAEGTCGLAVPVGQQSTLISFQNLKAPERVAGIHVFSEAGFLRTGLKPLPIDDSGRSLMLIERGERELRDAVVAVWHKDGLQLFKPGRLRMASLQDLGRAVAVEEGHSFRVLRWLRESLGQVGCRDNGLRAFLQELDGRARARVVSAAAVDERQKVGLTASFRARTGHLVVAGWVEGRFGDGDRIRWMGANDVRIDLSSRIIWADHHGIPAENPKDMAPSGRRRGFIATGRTPSTMVPFGVECFEVLFQSGRRIELSTAPGVTTSREARDVLLSLPRVPSDPDRLLAGGVAEVIAALHADALDRERVGESWQVGSPPRRPKGSIIIPVYQNLAFLKAQYVALALDPDIRRHELIYVIDDPAAAEPVKRLLGLLHEIYRLPAKVLVHRENFGYAPAVNTGAGQAGGSLLLFLNSDVIPAEAGFLATLSAHLKKDRKIGAVAPKLLFANGTLQHAGLDFYKDFNGRMFNRSNFKGYASGYGQANKRQRPKALTGACLLVRRAAFQAVGGFSEDYVIGDFEDTDLCLKLERAGFALLYEPAVTLSHFERQSIELHQIHRLSLAEMFNRHIHHRRWFSGEDGRTQARSGGLIGARAG